jgi:hypothetical protein
MLLREDRMRFGRLNVFWTQAADGQAWPQTRNHSAAGRRSPLFAVAVPVLVLETRRESYLRRGTARRLIGWLQIQKPSLRTIQ